MHHRHKTSASYMCIVHTCIRIKDICIMHTASCARASLKNASCKLTSCIHACLCTIMLTCIMGTKCNMESSIVDTCFALLRKISTSRLAHFCITGYTGWAPEGHWGRSQDTWRASSLKSGPGGPLDFKFVDYAIVHQIWQNLNAQWWYSFVSKKMALQWALFKLGACIMWQMCV